MHSLSSLALAVALPRNPTHKIANAIAMLGHKFLICLSQVCKNICACVLVCLFACVLACLLACLLAFLCAGLPACFSACLTACLLTRLLACVVVFPIPLNFIHAVKTCMPCPARRSEMKLLELNSNLRIFKSNRRDPLGSVCTLHCIHVHIDLKTLCYAIVSHSICPSALHTGNHKRTCSVV